MNVSLSYVAYSTVSLCQAPQFHILILTWEVVGSNITLSSVQWHLTEWTQELLSSVYDVNEWIHALLLLLMHCKYIRFIESYVYISIMFTLFLTPFTCPQDIHWGSMPKIKTSRVKYPEGWELIEPTIRELDAKMREGIHRWLFIWGTHYWCQLLFASSGLFTNAMSSCSWKWSTWWEEKVWSSLAYFPHFSSKEPLHIWSLLQKEGDITGALWVLPGPGLCRP